MLATVSRDRRTAARKTLTYFAAGGDAESLLNAVRQVMVLKGDDAHDFKFGAAILEDAAAVSPAWWDDFGRLHAAAERIGRAGQSDGESHKSGVGLKIPESGKGRLRWSPGLGLPFRCTTKG